MQLSKSLEKNKEMMGKALPLDKSFDLISREIEIGGVMSAFYFIDGFIKDEVVEKMIAGFQKITPEKMKTAKSASEFIAKFVSYVEVSSSKESDVVLENFLAGPSILIIDGFDEAIIMDTRTYPARSTEEPEKEKVMRGSRDGFVETVVFNTALIRRRIRDANFIVRMLRVGNSSGTDVAVAYMEGTAKPESVEKIISRIESIRVKSLTMNQESLAECLISGRWYNPFPKARYTERPDVAAAEILDGNIIILVDNDPSAMILPTSLFDFIQEPDDYYYPPITGSYLRLVRNLVFWSTLFIPPLWLLCIRNIDRLPEALQFLNIAEPNTIPVIIQLLILEAATDVLRLASVNTPSMLGNSLSIIGALLLGEFAVKSGWLVPDTILYMSFVAIASFAQPSIELNYAVKFMRVITLILTQLFNLWGFIIGILSAFITMGFNRTITGRSYLYPLIPFNYRSLKRHIVRMRLKSKGGEE